MYGKREEPEILKKTVKNVLSFAESHQCKSVAIPAISSGIFGFPKRLCAKIIYDTIEEFAAEHKDFFSKCEYLERVEITILDNETIDVFKEEFKRRYIYKYPPKDEYFYLYDSSFPSFSSYRMDNSYSRES